MSSQSNRIQWHGNMSGSVCVFELKVFIKFFSFKLEACLLHLRFELILLFSQHVRCEFQPIKEASAIERLNTKGSVFFGEHIGTKGCPAQCCQLLRRSFQTFIGRYAVSLSVRGHGYSVRLTKSASTVEVRNVFVFVIIQVIIHVIIKTILLNTKNGTE
jgi:hypothetical protein